MNKNYFIKIKFIYYVSVILGILTKENFLLASYYPPSTLVNLPYKATNYNAPYNSSVGQNSNNTYYAPPQQLSNTPTIPIQAPYYPDPNAIPSGSPAYYSDPNVGSTEPYYSNPTAAPVGTAPYYPDPTLSSSEALAYNDPSLGSIPSPPINNPQISYTPPVAQYAPAYPASNLYPAPLNGPGMPQNYIQPYVGIQNYSNPGPAYTGEIDPNQSSYYPAPGSPTANPGYSNAPYQNPQASGGNSNYNGYPDPYGAPGGPGIPQSASPQDPNYNQADSGAYPDPSQNAQNDASASINNDQENSGNDDLAASSNETVPLPPLVAPANSDADLMGLNDDLNDPVVPDTTEVPSPKTLPWNKIDLDALVGPKAKKNS